MLTTLVIESNKVLDAEAVLLADALRTNMRLCILNVEDNGSGPKVACLAEMHRGSRFVGSFVSYPQDAGFRLQRCPRNRLLLSVQTWGTLTGRVDKVITCTCSPGFTVTHAQPGSSLCSHIYYSMTDSADCHRKKFSNALF